MKKELLVATALVSSFGLIASSAEAATASFSGHARNGAVGKDKDSGANETFGAHQQASFSVSLSETTDGGIVVSTGFDLTDENDGATDVSGLTFTFTDGSKLDIIEAGNAYATHTASVPGASGEQGIGGVTANEAPTGLNFTDTSVATGFEWHSAADFGGVEGLKAGLSASIDDDSADASSTSTTDSSFSVGLSYVTDAGDTSVTIGGGYLSATDANSSTVNDKANEVTVAISAVTGDLTVGVGYSDGYSVASNAAGSKTDAAMEVDDATAVTAGVKYVSGDITFALGVTDGEAIDAAVGSDGTANEDTYESVGGSIDYVVAPGVTATLGWSDVSTGNDGSSSTGNSGSSWYLGANVSF